MKLNLLQNPCIMAVFMVFSTQTYAQVWTEDFEVDGEGLTYFSTGQFYDTPSDHYGRTDSASVDGEYINPNNMYFWAGEDVNDPQNPDMLSEDTLTFASIDIMGLTSLVFRGLFAVGTDGGLDSSDSLAMEYRVDEGLWIKFLSFDGPITGANVGWAEDTNLDGVGDGIPLVNTFQEFERILLVSGSSMEIRVFTSVNSGGEEFAFDYFQVFDSSELNYGCTDFEALNYAPSALFDDGSCVFDQVNTFCLGDADGNNIVNILDLVAVSSNFGNSCP